MFQYDAGIGRQVALLDRRKYAAPQHFSRGVMAWRVDGPMRGQLLRTIGMAILLEGVAVGGARNPINATGLSLMQQRTLLRCNNDRGSLPILKVSFAV